MRTSSSSIVPSLVGPRADHAHAQYIGRDAGHGGEEGAEHARALALARPDEDASVHLPYTGARTIVVLRFSCLLIPAPFYVGIRVEGTAFVKWLEALVGSLVVCRLSGFLCRAAGVTVTVRVRVRCQVPGIF